MQTVAVLRGGVGDEHDVSLKTGFNVIKRLEKSPYRPVDVYIDRTGVWHVRGMPVAPQRAVMGVDAVFNALHGQYGEDGGVQRELDRLGLPYTGSGAYPSSVAMNKILTKQMLAKSGIRLARHVSLTVTPDLDRVLFDLFRTFPQPAVIKPANSGSSVGVTLARSYHQFVDGVKKAFGHSKEVLVEEYIKGREATVGVINNFRGKAIYDLPPVEIILPAASPLFDFDAKYGGQVEERCPANFDRSVTEELQRSAAMVHNTLGLRHYSRSDFIVTPKNHIYFLEVNTLPGLTDQSLLPKSLDAVGATMDEFVAHVIGMALEKK